MSAEAGKPKQPTTPNNQNPSFIIIRILVQNTTAGDARGGQGHDRVSPAKETENSGGNVRRTKGATLNVIPAKAGTQEWVTGRRGGLRPALPPAPHSRHLSLTFFLASQQRA